MHDPGKRQTIILREHTVFDSDQLLFDSEGAGLRGKQLQRRAIAQRGFGVAQPRRGIGGLPCEHLQGAGSDARNTNCLISFFR